MYMGGGFFFLSLYIPFYNDLFTSRILCYSLDNFYKVIVALDPDAAYKTLEYKREIEAYTGLETIALRLYDDIKYKVDADIKKLEEIVL